MKNAAIKNIPALAGPSLWLLATLLLPCVGEVQARGNSAAKEQVEVGLVTRVVDGDTIWVRTHAGQKPVKVRFLGIDAPEICQNAGKASRQALAARILGKQVVLSFRYHDDYGRLLARVSSGGEDMGRWMVAQGHAWAYSYAHSGGTYAAEQLQARSARRGLFSDTGAEMPGDFRKRHGSCYAR
jgi:micrococcal nuclease